MVELLEILEIGSGSIFLVEVDLFFSRNIEEIECMHFLGFPLWEDLQAEWGHGEWSNNYKSSCCTLLQLPGDWLKTYILMSMLFFTATTLFIEIMHPIQVCSVAGITSDANLLTNELRFQHIFFGMYFHFMCLELVFIKLSQVDRSAVPVPIWRVHPLRATRLLALRHQTGFDFSEKCRNIPIVAFRRRTPSPAERGLLASPSCTWAGTSTLAISWWCLALFIHEFQSISVF